MNDVNYTKEQMVEFYKNMHGNVRGILLDDNFGYVFQVIGRENGISSIQSLDIEDITTLIIIGATPEKTLEQKIREKIGVTEEKAHKIAEDIRENILAQTRRKAEERPAVYSKIINTKNSSVQIKLNPPVKKIFPSFTKIKTNEKPKPKGLNLAYVKTPTATPKIPPSITPSVPAPAPIKKIIDETTAPTPVFHQEQKKSELDEKINTGSEHLFEKKLREAAKQLTSKEPGGTVLQTKPVEIPKPQKSKIDPYRELPSDTEQ